MGVLILHSTGFVALKVQEEKKNGVWEKQTASIKMMNHRG